MKATILESAEGRSVILAEDGVFYDIEGTYQKGEIIEYESGYKSAKTEAFSYKKTSVIKRIAAAAACLLIFLSGGIYSYNNLLVFANVTLDGDMPVICSLNRKGEVIRIRSMDESGDDLAENMLENGIKGRPIEEALEYAEKYITKYDTDDDGSTFEINVECKDKDEAKKLDKKLNSEYGDAAKAADNESKTNPSQSKNVEDRSFSDRKAGSGSGNKSKGSGSDTGKDKAGYGNGKNIDKDKTSGENDRESDNNKPSDEGGQNGGSERPAGEDGQGGKDDQPSGDKGGADGGQRKPENRQDAPNDASPQ